MALMQCPECAQQVSSEASACPSCGYPISPSNAEPGFRRYRVRTLRAGLITCIVALPIGLFMGLPGVWGLALLGIVVASVKLGTMRRNDAPANKIRIRPESSKARARF